MAQLLRYSLIDLNTLAAKVPWWAGLLAALATYALLHPIAMVFIATPSGTLDVAVSAVARLLLGAAAIGQYALPLAFLLLAAFSAFLNWKHHSLVAALTSDAGDSALRGLSRDEIALLLSTVFHALGFQVRKIQGFLRDAGFDLELLRDGKRFLLQHRHWKSYRIDAASLQPLGDLLEAVGADGGLVVISGQFTPNAVALANRRGLQLLDGSHLEELILAGQRGVRRGVDASRQREALERIERLVLGGGAPRPDERSLPSSAAQRPGHDLERPRGREAAEDAHEDLELAVGDALSALIHAETHTDAVPSAAGAAASIEPVARPRLTVQRSAGLRIGRVLDAIGMLIAGGLIWNAYAWFEALPVSSQGTPWRLAASVVPSPDTPGPTRPSREESATVRPLGRFEFGPAVQKSSSEEPEAPGRRALPAQETAEEYRSAQELEAAFNAKYVPPPECYDFSSAGQMASCGNHRIRSRRAFIESNGQSFDPAAAIQEAGQPRITQDEETGWIAPEEGALAGSEPARGWESQRAWATKPGWLSQDREAAKRWRAMSDWSARGGWQPRREPLDDRAQEDGSDRQSEMDRQPRIQRQAVQDWRAPSGWRSQPEPSHHPRPAGNSQWQHKWLKEPEPSGAQDW